MSKIPQIKWTVTKASFTVASNSSDKMSKIACSGWSFGKNCSPLVAGVRLAVAQIEGIRDNKKMVMKINL